MTRPEPISVDDFFKPPARAQASIAPDGTHVAFLAPWQNRLNIWVAPLDGDGKSRRVASDQTRSIQNFSWTDDPRWLLYLQDTGGDEN
jgi:Tol biopolymer transport system component